HLDHEFVARRRNEIGRVAQPLGQLTLAGGRDPIPLLRSLALSGGFDEPVPLEPLERRVDLPDVQRPHIARSRLEFALQPQSVLRPLSQQSKECMGNAHEEDAVVDILSIYTRYRDAGQALLRDGGAGDVRVVSRSDDVPSVSVGCEIARLSVLSRGSACSTDR